MSVTPVKEKDIQKEVVNYMRELHLLFTSTCGGVAYKPHQRRILYDTGYTKGAPDLFVFEPRGKFNGLAIEMKARNGRLSPYQQAFLHKLRERGYMTAVCFSLDSAKRSIDLYLAQDSEPAQPPQDPPPSDATATPYHMEAGSAECPWPSST